ncbi:MAG: hypothetical protein JNL38_03560 [Myxococcales bacterium]|jgi:hypothetical protein|nr:hypothetical protein [Myxococcales bacterium]
MLRKLIVSSYKVAGFVILLGILGGLFSYVVMTLFYYGSSSWIAPVILSPGDRRVLELTAQLAQQQGMRDTLAAQRLDMATRLKDAERTAVAEEEFQRGFARALEADVADRKTSLAKLHALRKSYASTGQEIAAANGSFSDLSKDRLTEMYAAHLISKDDMIKGNLQIAELANVNLGLSERGTMLDDQVSSLGRQAGALSLFSDTLRTPTQVGSLPSTADSAKVSRDALTAWREYELSVLAGQRARDAQAALKEGIASIDGNLARYDAIIAAIKETPHLKASDHHLSIAFVPYDNMANAKPGSAIYACRLNIVVCRRVGKVGKALDGEVTGAHPLQKMDLRGQMVGLELDDIHSAQEPVLHVGRAPFLL